jgi:hypothetical protein
VKTQIHRVLEREVRKGMSKMELKMRTCVFPVGSFTPLSDSSSARHLSTNQKIRGIFLFKKNFKSQ